MSEISTDPLFLTWERFTMFSVSFNQLLRDHFHFKRSLNRVQVFDSFLSRYELDDMSRYVSSWLWTCFYPNFEIIVQKSCRCLRTSMAFYFEHVSCDERKPWHYFSAFFDGISYSARFSFIKVFIEDKIFDPNSKVNIVNDRCQS